MRRNIWRYRLFIIGLAISCLIMLLSGENLGIKIAASVLLFFFSMCSVSFDIRHPLFWFIAALLVYSVSGALLLELDVHPWGSYLGMKMEQYNFQKALDLSFIAMLCSALFITPIKKEFKLTSHNLLTTLKIGNYVVFVSTLALCVVHLIYIVSGGYAGKGEVVLSRNPLAGSSFAFNILIVSISIFLFDYMRRRKIFKYIVFSGGFALFFLFTIFLIGHRNIFYRFLVVILFIPLVSLKTLNIRLRHVIVVICFLSLAMSMSGILGSLKMVLLKDEVQTVQIENPLDLAIKHPEVVQQYDKFSLFFLQSMLNIFGSEFMTAGNVLTVILEYVPETYPYLAGRSFVWDLTRAVSPGFLLNRDIETTSTYFVKKIWPDFYARGEGPGFSLVGLGYVNFGMLGVILVFSVYGYVLRKLYFWATKNQIGMIFYVNYIAIGILTLRYDLSAPISQSWKHILLPLFFMYLLGNEVTRLRRKRTNIELRNGAEIIEVQL